MNASTLRILALTALLFVSASAASAQLPMTAEDFSDDHTDNLAVTAGQFDPLTDATIRGHFEDLLDDLLAGDTGAAAGRLTDLTALSVHYELIEITDAGGTLPVLGFRESVANTHPDFRGWGPVLVRPHGALDVVYHAPHPIDDQHTEDIALDAYLQDCCAAVAVFSGARRNASGDGDGDGEEDTDAAHDPDSLFHVVVEHTATLSAAAPALQVQVHAAQNRSSEPTITGSDGADRPPWPAPAAGHPAVEVDEQVDADGFVSMGVCDFAEGSGDDEDGDYLLCARTNVQGDFLETVGQRERFLHFEIERTARDHFHLGSGPGFDGIRGLFRAVRTLLGPELEIAALTAPTTACPTEDVRDEMTMAIANRGDADAGAFQIGWYLSTDPVRGGDKALTAAADPVLSLAAGTTVAVNLAPKQIPAGTPHGNWYLLAVIDDTNAHAERLEGNNVVARPIVIEPCPIVEIPEM